MSWLSSRCFSLSSNAAWPLTVVIGSDFRNQMSCKGMDDRLRQLNVEFASVRHWAPPSIFRCCCIRSLWYVQTEDYFVQQAFHFRSCSGNARYVFHSFCPHKTIGSAFQTVFRPNPSVEGEKGTHSCICSLEGAVMKELQLYCRSRIGSAK